MCTVNMIIVISVYKFKMPADANNSSHLSLDSKNNNHILWSSAEQSMLHFTEVKNTILPN